MVVQRKFRACEKLSFENKTKSGLYRTRARTRAISLSILDDRDIVAKASPSNEHSGWCMHHRGRRYEQFFGPAPKHPILHFALYTILPRAPFCSFSSESTDLLYCCANEDAWFQVFVLSRHSPRIILHMKSDNFCYSIFIHLEPGS